ncbi:unnamed protein product, partial [Meganyctiphanes norvegica]
MISHTILLSLGAAAYFMSSASSYLITSDSGVQTDFDCARIADSIHRVCLEYGPYIERGRYGRSVNVEDLLEGNGRHVPDRFRFTYQHKAFLPEEEANNLFSRVKRS